MLAVPKVESLDQIWLKKPIRRHVLEFAVLFSIIFILVAAYFLYFYGVTTTVIAFSAAAAVTAPLGYGAPAILTPIWRYWMIFAGYLGTFMSFFILSLCWIAMVVPIAMLLRIIGKRVMDTTFDRTKSSYWETREEKQHNFQLLERQF